MGHSAQQIKHENAQKTFARFFAKFVALTTTQLINICRRNVALDAVKRKVFWQPLRFMDVRALGSRLSACLSKGPDRSFARTTARNDPLVAPCG